MNDPHASSVPHTAPPWCRVVVVNYNSGDLLQRCVDALAGQTMYDFEVVIVDNASTDGSAERLCLPDGRFTLIQSDTNLGFAAANNLAARNCHSAWIATLNPDTEPHNDWLAQMRRGTISYPGTHMLGATLVAAEDPNIVDGFGDMLSIVGIAWRSCQGQPVTILPDYDCEAFGPCAAAALYHRKTFQAVGGFDEQFFCYIEDVDIAFRLRMRGERCVQLRNAIVRHHGSAITGKVSAFTIFHSFRNRLWMIRKNMPATLLSISLLGNLAFSLLQIASARHVLPVKAALHGLWSGLSTRPCTLKTRKRIQKRRRVTTAKLMNEFTWNVVNFLYLKHRRQFEKACPRKPLFE